VYIQYTFAFITQSTSTNTPAACRQKYEALGIMNKKTNEIVEKLPRIIQGIAECMQLYKAVSTPRWLIWGYSLLENWSNTDYQKVLRDIQNTEDNEYIVFKKYIIPIPSLRRLPNTELLTQGLTPVKALPERSQSIRNQHTCCRDRY
jgi:hypothetical protein